MIIMRIMRKHELFTIQIKNCFCLIFRYVKNILKNLFFFLFFFTIKEILQLNYYKKNIQAIFWLSLLLLKASYFNFKNVFRMQSFLKIFLYIKFSDKFF